MKKIILSIIAAAAVCFSAAAQPASRPANEIAASYGVVSVIDFAYSFGGIFATVFTVGAVKPETMKSSGVVALEYYHYLAPHAAIGCLLGWEQYQLSFASINGKDASGNTEYKPGEVSTDHFISIMPCGKFPWFNKDHFGMYSKVGAGCMLNIDSDEGAKFNFAAQVNPIGMEFGGTSCRGFLELGWGVQGLVMGGVKYCF